MLACCPYHSGLAFVFSLLDSFHFYLYNSSLCLYYTTSPIQSVNGFPIFPTIHCLHNPILEHFQHLSKEVSFVSFLVSLCIYDPDNKDDWDTEAGYGGSREGWLVGQGCRREGNEVCPLLPVEALLGWLLFRLRQGRPPDHHLSHSGMQTFSTSAVWSQS